MNKKIYGIIGIAIVGMLLLSLNASIITHSNQESIGIDTIRSKSNDKIAPLGMASLSIELWQNKDGVYANCEDRENVVFEGREVEIRVFDENGNSCDATSIEICKGEESEFKSSGSIATWFPPYLDGESWQLKVTAVSCDKTGTKEFELKNRDLSVEIKQPFDNKVVSEGDSFDVSVIDQDQVAPYQGGAKVSLVDSSNPNNIEYFECSYESGIATVIIPDVEGDSAEFKLTCSKDGYQTDGDPITITVINKFLRVTIKNSDSLDVTGSKVFENEKFTVYIEDQDGEEIRANLFPSWTLIPWPFWKVSSYTYTIRDIDDDKDISISARLDGYDEGYAELTVKNFALNIEIPESVDEGDKFTATVTDQDGESVPAIIKFNEDEYERPYNLIAPRVLGGIESENYPVTAIYNGHEAGSKELIVNNNPLEGLKIHFKGDYELDEVNEKESFEVSVTNENDDSITDGVNIDFAGETHQYDGGWLELQAPGVSGITTFTIEAMKYGFDSGFAEIDVLDDTEDLKIVTSVDYVDEGDSFTVKVLDSSDVEIDDGSLKISFNGQSSHYNPATFEAPDVSSDEYFEITAEADDYNSGSASIQVIWKPAGTLDVKLYDADGKTELEVYEVVEGEKFVAKVIDDNGEAVDGGATIVFNDNDYPTTDQVTLEAPSLRLLQRQDEFDVEVKKDDWRGAIATITVTKQSLSNCILYGKVIDSETGKGIPNAVVKKVIGSGSTQTDNDGHYELILDPGLHWIKVSAEGYDEKKEWISISSDTEKDFILVPEPLKLKVKVVDGSNNGIKLSGALVKTEKVEDGITGPGGGTTNSQGEYTLEFPRVDIETEYILIVTKDGYEDFTSYTITVHPENYITQGNGRITEYPVTLYKYSQDDNNNNDESELSTEVISVITVDNNVENTENVVVETQNTQTVTTNVVVQNTATTTTQTTTSSISTNAEGSFSANADLISKGISI